jgi:hypothetical protein
VLEDDELRSGIKEFSNWPTIPQLYVKGEFVGGCDIIREMFQNQELQGLFTEKGVRDRSKRLISSFNQTVFEGAVFRPFFFITCLFPSAGTQAVPAPKYLID